MSHTLTSYISYQLRMEATMAKCQSMLTITIPHNESNVNAHMIALEGYYFACPEETSASHVK
jgi:hypothetical protein